MPPAPPPPRSPLPLPPPLPPPPEAPAALPPMAAVSEVGTDDTETLALLAWCAAAAAAAAAEEEEPDAGAAVAGLAEEPPPPVVAASEDLLSLSSETSVTEVAGLLLQIPSEAVVKKDRVWTERRKRGKKKLC